jgi:hypothetical protein
MSVISQKKSTARSSVKYCRSEHIVHFDGFMKEKPLTDEFEVFLKKEKLISNVRHLHFYLDVLKFEKISKEGQTDFFEMIDKLYIDKASEEYIEVFSIETKLKYYSTLKKFQKEKEIPKELFEDMVSSVLNELKYESFPRFIRTPVCDKLMNNYLLNSEVVSPKDAVKFDYSEKDFEHCFVSDKDIDFVKVLLNDGYHWELIGSVNDDNINTFWCNVNFMPNVPFLKGSYMVKYEYVLNHSLEKVLSTCIPLDKRLKFDSTIGRVELLDYLPFSEMRRKYPSEKFKDIRSHSLMKYDVITPFPLNTRVWFPTTSMVYDKQEKQFIHVLKSFKQEIEFGSSTEMTVVSSKGAKEKKAKVYIAFNFLATSMKRLSDNSTLFTQINLVDIGGWGANQLIIKKVVAERSIHIQKSLIQTISEYPQEYGLKDVMKMVEEDDRKDIYATLMCETLEKEIKF